MSFGEVIKSANVVAAGDTAPSSPSDGDIWFDTTVDLWKKWDPESGESGEWIAVGGFVPPGGIAGEVLRKASDTDFDVEWVTLP